MRPLKWLVLLVLIVVLGSASAEPLSFVLDTTENRATEVQAIASQLQDVGIDVQVRVWRTNVLREEIEAGNRSAYTTDWGSAYFDPFDLGIPKFQTGGRGNFSFYSSPEVDEAFEIAATTTDREARREAYFDAQQTIHEDAPWVFGYILENIEASTSDVSGWSPAADNSESLHDVALEGGDTLVLGMRTDQIVTFDPAMYRDRDTEAVLRNIFDSLVARTRDGEVVPQLATDWSQLDDTTFEFRLEQGATFHDGTALTSDDIVFTFDRIIREGAVDGQTSPRKGLLGPLDDVTAVDEHTVRFHYTAPFPQTLLEQALVHFQIVPAQYMREVGTDGFVQEPIGSGPYRFLRGSLDDQIVLEANEDYWGGAPEVDQVVFRMMPEPSTRIASLLSGEVHIIQSVPPDLVDRVEGAPNIEVRTAQGTRAYMIELNNDRPPFDDVRVRRALNYAIDWDAILDNIYQGYGERLATAFLPTGFGHDPDLAPYPHDPDRARELLQEAGYDVE